MNLNNIKLNIFNSAAFLILIFSMHSIAQGMEESKDVLSTRSMIASLRHDGDNREELLKQLKEQDLKVSDAKEFYELREKLIDIAIELYRDLDSGLLPIKRIVSTIEFLSYYYKPLVEFPKIDGVGDWKNGSSQRKFFLEVVSNPDTNLFTKMPSLTGFTSPLSYVIDADSHDYDSYQRDYTYFLKGMKHEVKYELSI